MMVLNLDPYQVSRPYPELRRVKTDPKLAAMLMEGYSGAVSEMTTVLQYAYHSLRCKKSYEEISAVMRGIFYVETMHLELLGNCVQRLGIDPLYQVALQDKTVSWQSELVEYAASPAKMLWADLEGEKQAVEFYLQMSVQAKEQPDVAKLLARLAEDEKLHVKILTDLYRRTFRS